ncbi:hypothetical protein VBD025_13610 [Virgibacillus flavescens]|uniref:hypothetical protein n=1 Tax=Virgibacillus flavescens TaxID=1611422 RepID=UPI003D34AD17
MDKIGKILDAIQKKENELNQDTSIIIQENIKDKSKEDVRKYLENILGDSPVETGGKNALTGFYFQLLCTLYYLAEVLEGKWDFLILELHQDIVVGNDSIIRFIQVKSEVLSDRKPVKSVSKTDLYKGWIQKLISMARLFPKGEGVKTEFELMTNYIMKDSTNIRVEHYMYNSNFDQYIEDNDDIVKKVSEYKNRGLDENFDYENSCNESIKELLSRFCIQPKAIDPDKLDDFIGTISHKLGKLINESAGVSFADINYLLGELCFECNHTNQGSLMHIDKERAFKYLQILKQRASDNLEGFYTDRNNNELIDEIVTNLNGEYLELQQPIREQINDELENFRYQLKKWASEDIPIHEMVHRYLEGKSFSLKLNTMQPLKLRKKAEEIFKTLFILEILFDEEIKFSKSFNGILIKEVSNAYISIVGLDIDQNLEEGIGKLNDIIEKASNEEKILILMQNNHTIFQGEYDEDDFTNEEIFDVEEMIKFASEYFPQGKSVKDVDYKWTIIPGIKFIAFLKKVRRYEDIFQFKSDIQAKWEILLK